MVKNNSKNNFLNLDHVSTRPLLASSLLALTRVHQRWARPLNKNEIVLTLSYFESSPSNKFSTVLKNNRIASDLRLTPPKKVGAYMLLQMLCKRFFLLVSFLSFLFSSCPSIFCFDEEEKVFEEEGDLAFLFSFYPIICPFLHSHNDNLEDCIKNWFRQWLMVGILAIVVFLKWSATK